MCLNVMVFVRLQGDDGRLVCHSNGVMFVAKPFIIFHIVARSFNAARLVCILLPTARSLVEALRGPRRIPRFAKKSLFRVPFLARRYH